MLGPRLRLKATQKATHRVTPALVEALEWGEETVAMRLNDIERSPLLGSLLAMGIVRRRSRTGRLPRALREAYSESWVARLVRSYGLDERHPGWIADFQGARPRRDARRLAARYGMSESEAVRLISYLNFSADAAPATQGLEERPEPTADVAASEGADEDAVTEIAELVRAHGVTLPEFRALFLDGEADQDAVASRLGCDAVTVGRLLALVSQLQITDARVVSAARGDAFRYAAPDGRPRGIIAELVSSPDGCVEVTFTGSVAAGGVYEVDWARARTLKALGDEEQVQALIASIGWVSERTGILRRAVLSVAAYQERYLLSASAAELAPLSQSDTARILGISRSTVCRAVAHRLVCLPWGQIVPLQHLYARTSECVVRIAQADPALSAARIAQALKSRFGVDLAPRTVSYHLSRARR